MLLGFISLLLTVGQSLISGICISKELGATWHPCNKKQEATKYSSYVTGEEDRRRKLLVADGGGSFRRILAAGGTDKCAAKACLLYFRILCSNFAIFLTSLLIMHSFFRSFWLKCHIPSHTISDVVTNNILFKLEHNLYLI